MVDRAPSGGSSLVVFSDDWGRHPSSCQHLVRHLLPMHPTLWVNTIGMRAPRLDLATVRRAAEKLRHWSRPKGTTKPPQPRSPCADISRSTDSSGHEAPTVVSPRMWPWFTRGIDRRLNRMLLTSQLDAAIAQLPRPVVAITTLPITADLIGRLPVDRWIYYCVDDFREWPGLDGRTMDRMEADLIPKVNAIVAVSQTLQRRIREFGRESHLLTHGCDLDFWQPAIDAPEPDPGRPPRVVFWGVIDRRMDLAFVRKLAYSLNEGSIELVGPLDNPDPELLRLPRVRHRPPMPLQQLPQLAAEASVLIMPYVDAPVTRAMQPLKLKEYLATGKPAVVRALPATLEWRDAMDVTETPEQFAEAVSLRLETGLPDSQRLGRQRLASESWSAKAALFQQWILDLSRRPSETMALA